MLFNILNCSDWLLNKFTTHESVSTITFTLDSGGSTPRNTRSP